MEIWGLCAARFAVIFARQFVRCLDVFLMLLYVNIDNVKVEKEYCTVWLQIRVRVG